MRSYEAARSLFGFLEFIFWSLVIVGILAGLAAANVASRGYGGGGFLAALPGLAVALLGLLGVAMIQNARAGVDAAEYSQQMLKVARDQLELSKQALRSDQAKPSRPSFSAAKGSAATDPAAGIEDGKPARAEPPIANPQHRLRYINANCTRMEYRGSSITQLQSGRFLVDEADYSDLDAAKAAIDKQHERA